LAFAICHLPSAICHLPFAMMEPVSWVTTMNHTQPLRNPLHTTVLLAALLALSGAAASDEIRLSALDLGAAS